MKTVGVILAGGKSTRFGGQDKGDLLWRGRRLIDHVHANLQRQVGALFVSGPHDYGLGIPIIPDRRDGPEGPLGGIWAVYHYLRQLPDITGFLTVPVDAPLFPETLARVLTAQGDSAISMIGNRANASFAYWRLDQLSAVFDGVDWARSPALMWFSDQVGSVEAVFNNPDAFTNINKPDDLAALRGT